MMKISPDSTTMHPARGMDPEKFRAQATGIGQTASASLATGRARAMRVVNQTDADCRALWPKNEGFPAVDAMGYPVYTDPLPVPNAVADSQDGTLSDLSKRLA